MNLCFLPDQVNYLMDIVLVKILIEYVTMFFKRCYMVIYICKLIWSEAGLGSIFCLK